MNQVQRVNYKDFGRTPIIQILVCIHPMLFLDIKNQRDLL